MRRRGWRHLARDRSAWGPALVLGVLVAGFGLPRACDTGRDAVRAYRVAQWEDPIRQYAESRGLEPALVRAVVLAESSGNPEAHSPADAKGLMQITPITHRDAIERFHLADGDLFDPHYNLKVGTAYLAYLLDRFDGDRTLALAAYHMGPTRVARLRREHAELSPSELVAQHAGPKTRAYVRRVLEETAGAEETPEPR
ncbi:MAG: lytic transglycosylase domain-containing protein [Planctomycetota bacterium]